MKKEDIKLKALTIRFDKQIMKVLVEYEKKYGVSKAEAVRQFVKEGLKLQSTVDSVGLINKAVKRGLEEVMSPLMENRLIPLIAKSTRASLEMKYLNMLYLSNESAKISFKEAFWKSKEYAESEIKKKYNK